MFKLIINRLFFGLTMTGINYLNLPQSHLLTNPKDFPSNPTDPLIFWLLSKGLCYFVSYPFSPILILYDCINHYNSKKNSDMHFKSHFILGSKYIILNDETPEFTFNRNQSSSRW